MDAIVEAHMATYNSSTIVRVHQQGAHGHFTISLR